MSSLSNVSRRLDPTKFCADPDCACVECLRKCDDTFDRGMIPTNGSWWAAQDKFVPTMPIGDWGPR